MRVLGFALLVVGLVPSTLSLFNWIRRAFDVALSSTLSAWVDVYQRIIPPVIGAPFRLFEISAPDWYISAATLSVIFAAAFSRAVVGLAQRPEEGEEESEETSATEQAFVIVFVKASMIVLSVLFTLFFGYTLLGLLLAVVYPILAVRRVLGLHKPTEAEIRDGDAIYGVFTLYVAATVLLTAGLFWLNAAT